MDSDINYVDIGQCLAANSDRIWVQATAFNAGTNYVSVSYFTAT